MRSKSVHTFSPFFYLLALPIWVAAAACGQASDWPQWLGTDREGVWRETGLLDKFPPGGPKVLWRTPIGTGYSGPAVAGDRVYVMDRQRAQDAAGKPRRATKEGIPGTERLLCLHAANGKILWKDVYDCPYRISYPSGPRTTPLVRDGRVYALGAMGDLRCLDAKSGSVHWAINLARDYQVDPPAWGWAAHPLLDGDLLYCLVGDPDSAVVAFHKATGKAVWKALSTEEVGYSPPTIIEAGGKRQLLIWLSESINSLDPATGKVYWTLPYPVSGQPQRPAVNIAQLRRAGDLLFLSTYYHGPMMLKLAADKPAATLFWKGKSENVNKPDGLHILMAAPVLKDGYIYGVCANGELRCLRADNGKQLWQTYAATGGKKTDCANVFLVPKGNQFILFNDQGDLILANLSPAGYKEIDRAHVLEPVQEARGRNVVWSHPAFAHRCVFVRNDKEIICLSLAAGSKDQALLPARGRTATRGDVLRMLIGAAVLAIEPEKDDPSKKDLDKLQGDWASLSMIVDGQKLPDDDAQVLFRTVKGDTYTVYRYKKLLGKGTFKLDASKKPKTIDSYPANAKDKTKPILGIYEFDGENFRTCYARPGKERPTDFSAKEGSEHTVVVWEREKK
jgi:uncharacterized protein (TIGR03067 family)